MKIGITSGHSRNTDISQRLFEWERCSEAETVLVQLLASAGHDVIQPTSDIYDSDNNASLRSRIHLFNDSEVEIALELHSNGGGGDYSTAIYWDHQNTQSAAGQEISEDICGQFEAGLPWRTIGARAQSYFGRSLAFLNSTTMPAVIIEPAFKDNDEQRAWAASQSGPVQYAALVFAGIQRYSMREGEYGKAA